MSSKKIIYDLIVIGAGHAGIEAAYASARLGVSVLLVTLSLDNIGKLSCNPAIGGVSKGCLVREVDALGGLIGRLADTCAVNYRQLNKSKGKAVWATRVQVDMFRYPGAARARLEREPNIRLLEAKADEIVIKNKQVIGIKTSFGEVFNSRAVIVCAGTFLRGLLHIGMSSFPGGRLSELSGDELCSHIEKLGLKTKFFKTGTCARLDAQTIDFSRMQEQLPDYDLPPFSALSDQLPAKQLSCFITHTNKKTHRIIMKNLDRSPLFTGKIKAHGVRYCPSLEDKVFRFPDKESHQVFIEPEGWDTVEVYPNGVSTSLPYDVQEEFIHTIAGLEKAAILRPGYGIEHGLIDPTQLYPTLETKKIKGLFVAGQVNGTTGYEEAAAQGIIAGINAALQIKKKKPFLLGREDALIGVMIDDLTGKGTDEPYRMFTSRSEFRLMLRESNADLRLTPLAYKIGLAGKNRMEKVKKAEAGKQAALRKMITTRVRLAGLPQKQSLFEYLKRPEISFEQIAPHISGYVHDLLLDRELEIEARYQGFIRREQSQAEELKRMDKVKIPARFDYDKVPSLSREVREKLKYFRPPTLGRALRISGITPAAVMAIYSRINCRKPRNKSRK